MTTLLRALAAVGAVIALTPAAPALPNPAGFAAAARAAQNRQNSHAHHLLRAEQDLKAAAAAIAANNPGQAEKSLGAAHHQVELAIRHHQQYAGRFRSTRSAGYRSHHQHHTHLQKAAADIKAAERQVKTGNTARATKDIQAAERQVQVAISHEKTLARR